MRPTLGQARPHRQQRLRATQRLDLGFLIEAEHHGLGRRMQIQPDDVMNFRSASGSVLNLNVSIDAVATHARARRGGPWYGTRPRGRPSHAYPVREPPGGGFSVMATMRAVFRSVTVGGRPNRG